MWGIGDLGKSAYDFVDFLKETDQKLWQILPLVIPDSFGSPYASNSAFAGNTMLISPQELLKEKLVSQNDISKLESKIKNQFKRKKQLLNIAYNNFLNRNVLKKEFEIFIKEESFWIEYTANFLLLKKGFKNKSWIDFPKEFKNNNEISTVWKKENGSELEEIKFEQFLFFHQWKKIKEYAHANNIEIIGDIPIFVSYDSADVWANRSIFKLDPKGKPKVVAGVPPDYFSKTGQLWGNPHYNWEILKEKDYFWWVNRIKHTLKMVDYIRADHFRGFEAAWEVPIEEKTAINGKWVKGPGAFFFNFLKTKIDNLPIIAEDLGVITDEVIKLRDEFNFPGMKILQFAFDSENNKFLPQNYDTENCVVYTGTHDNNTTLGWYNNEATENDKKNVYKFTDFNGENISWSLIRLAMRSKAIWSIIPMQDILNLDESARMNFPGKTENNWQWKMKDLNISNEIKNNLKMLTNETRR